MSNHKILITDGLDNIGQTILRKSSSVEDRTGISADELLEIISEFDAIVVRGRTKVTANVFQAAKNLKVVGRAGVGVDNIDLSGAASDMTMDRKERTTVAAGPGGAAGR